MNFSGLKSRFYLIKYLGVRWILFRMVHVLKYRSYYFLLKARAAENWDALVGHHNLINFSNFFCQENSFLFNNYLSCEKNIAIADGILNGYFPFFSTQKLFLGRFPDWHKNYRTGEISPKNIHWSLLSDFAYGDIKIILESNRFSFVYCLARAYARTQNQLYCYRFWELFEDWYTNNPPNLGVNWKCGQEIAFRAMALIFGAVVFNNSPYSTEERYTKLCKVLSFSVKRIELNLAYAISQKNNHGISEAMALWTMGVLFHEDKLASRWKKKGAYWLEKLAEDLIYTDGAFSQHSMNYHRVMLDDYLWVIAIAEKNNYKFSENFYHKIELAFLFLRSCIDMHTGQVPNYGHNDGALILPLTDCSYKDFRPTLQALHYFFYKNRLFKEGDWDEMSYWLFGGKFKDAKQSAALVQKSLCSEQSGYYYLRSNAGGLFLRCPSKFYHRPGQADVLHVDLWWKGVNVLFDPGTYSYNGPGNWNNYYSSSAAHNVVIVDDQDQMKTISRFLRIPWLKGGVKHNLNAEISAPKYIEGFHTGYEDLRDPVFYKRLIIEIEDDVWVIVDRLFSRGMHNYTLHYNIPNYPYDRIESCIKLNMPAGSYYIYLGSSDDLSNIQLVKGGEKKGTFAPGYYKKADSISVSLSFNNSKGIFWSVFSSKPVLSEYRDECIQVKIENRAYNICLTVFEKNKDILKEVCKEEL